MLPFSSSRSRTLPMSKRSYFASRTPRATFSKSQNTAMLFVSFEFMAGMLLPLPLVVPQPAPLQPSFEPAAGHEHDDDRREGHAGEREIARAAGHADRGRRPDRGRRGETLDAPLALVLHDHARADESDPRDDSLDGPAHGIADRPRPHGDDEDGERRAKGHQGVGLQARGAFLDLAVEADQAARQHGRAEAKRDLGDLEGGRHEPNS